MQVHVRANGEVDWGRLAGFEAGTAGLHFEAGTKAEVYAWVEEVLGGQRYLQRNRRERGRIRAVVEKLTGRSPAQVSRWISQYREAGRVRLKRVRRPCFARRYNDEDLRLLAEADELHGGLSGAAMRKVLEREHAVYGRTQYERLAHISVSHLYNLRGQPRYRAMSGLREKTRPVRVGIAERRPPEPRGRPGFLRVDTVHQGDHSDGTKGAYHINTVDSVTQWEVLGSIPRINEAYLLPLLEALWEQYPFVILGFHSDNGSEFINHQVAGMLNRLCVEFTKSRSCRSNDNALVEGKNNAVVRKHMGYGYLPATAAEPINAFYRQHLNPYLNFHRPCGFARVHTDARGRRRRLYRLADYATPLEKLQSLPNFEQYLRPGLTAARLGAIAAQHSDTQAAAQMQAAKAKLFAAIRS